MLSHLICTLMYRMCVCVCVCLDTHTCTHRAKYRLLVGKPITFLLFGRSERWKNNFLMIIEGERKWLRLKTNCWAFVLAVLNSPPLLYYGIVNYNCE